MDKDISHQGNLMRIIVPALQKRDRDLSKAGFEQINEEE
jgi:hypothetical protein